MTDRLAEIAEWLQFALDSHLKWAEHLEAHAASGQSCPECDERPYKLDSAQEREWVRRYTVILAHLQAQADTIALLEGERDTARAELVEKYRTVPPDKLNVAGRMQYDRAEAAEQRLARLEGALREVERHCPCGARPESLDTHPHVTGCPVGAALGAQA